MGTYFKYEKKQRVVATTLLLNAGLLFLMYFALKNYVPEPSQRSAVEEIIDIADVVIWLLEAVLLGLAAYFWIKNQSFKLRVTPSELYYEDPTFSHLIYRIPVNDIVSIKQITGSDQVSHRNILTLKDGSSLHLMYGKRRLDLMYGNYRIDREAFFKALKKANAKIEVPEHSYRYKAVRPAWATRLLGKSDKP